MKDNLRSSVIKLAHANPNLRPHLLPLLVDRVAAPKPKARKPLPDLPWGLDWPDVFKNLKDLPEALSTAREVKKLTDASSDWRSKSSRGSMSDSKVQEYKDRAKELGDEAVAKWKELLKSVPNP